MSLNIICNTNDLLRRSCEDSVKSYRGSDPASSPSLHSKFQPAFRSCLASTTLSDQTSSSHRKINFASSSAQATYRTLLQTPTMASDGIGASLDPRMIDNLSAQDKQKLGQILQIEQQKMGVQSRTSHIPLTSDHAILSSFLALLRPKC
jgi:hypothetical protein